MVVTGRCRPKENETGFCGSSQKSEPQEAQTGLRKKGFREGCAIAGAEANSLSILDGNRLESTAS